MKFDASRVESSFRELGDPQYAGPDGEPKVADFVAGQFEKMGLMVDQREAAGSRFPQRAAPWVGWPGYGALLTMVYGLLLVPGVLSTILGFGIASFSFLWHNAVVAGRIRPGRGRPPLENAPVVIASRAGDHDGSARVVFQVVLGRLRSDDLRPAGRSDGIDLGLRLVTVVLFVSLLGSRIGLLLNPSHVRSQIAYTHLMRYTYPCFLVLVWIGILGALFRRYRRAGREGESPQIDRRGLAVVLEMARTWPKAGSRAIEPVFAAVGGQQLDHAGSREVIRRLRSEWSSRPTLLIYLLAPGAGRELGLFTMDSLDSDLHELAREAAKSLWVPIQDGGPVTMFPGWPFDDDQPAVALIGSEPRARHDDSVDAQALHRAAQLATEIALRGARKHEAARARHPAG
jgi:hypothetical protein